MMKKLNHLVPFGYTMYKISTYSLLTFIFEHFIFIKEIVSSVQSKYMFYLSRFFSVLHNACHVKGLVLAYKFTLKPGTQYGCLMLTTNMSIIAIIVIYDLCTLIYFGSVQTIL